MESEFFYSNDNYPHDLNDTWLDLRIFCERYNLKLNHAVGMLSIREVIAGTKPQVAKLPALTQVEITPPASSEGYEQVGVNLSVLSADSRPQIIEGALSLVPHELGVIIKIKDSSDPFLKTFWEALQQWLKEWCR